jgi:hypothetical protein
VGNGVRRETGLDLDNGFNQGWVYHVLSAGVVDMRFEFRWATAVNRSICEEVACVSQRIPFCQQDIPGNRAIANHPLAIWALVKIQF